MSVCPERTALLISVKVARLTAGAIPVKRTALSISVKVARVTAGAIPVKSDEYSLISLKFKILLATSFCSLKFF